MQNIKNKRQGIDRENYRIQSNQRNYAAEDNRNQFQDPDYDRYFPEQNSYHPRNDYLNPRNTIHSDYIHQSQGPSSVYGQNPYVQNSTQSWSQPVRNDEVPQSNSHFGKGPKGFKRSDDKIRDDVSEALFHDHAVDASEIEVSVTDGEVTLSGTVSERRMKRLAEDCIDEISGVKDVRNEIRVQPSLLA